MPNLWQEFRAKHHPEEAYSNPHRREVCLRHLSEVVHQGVLSQVAQTCAQQRAALQVRRLPKDVRQRRQSAQTLEDERLRAQQRRRADTYRFDRLRCRR